MKQPAENPWRKTYADVLQEAAARMVKLSVKMEEIVRGLQVHLKGCKPSSQTVVDDLIEARAKLSTAIHKAAAVSCDMLNGDLENPQVAEEQSELVSPEDFLKKMMGT